MCQEYKATIRVGRVANTADVLITWPRSSVFKTNVDVARNAKTNGLFPSPSATYQNGVIKMWGI
jgi:hypothetical protein